ncbi:hypothetical protein TNCV_4650521 [Trichonephila clavipes]|nr:hypothetical protein TNCV_4650521 [Trichonephila clavipes]
MRARNYRAYPNIRDHWTLRCMNRCPDLMVCLKRDLQCLRPQASLVLIYRPNVAGMKGIVDLAQPVNRTPVPTRHRDTLNSRRTASPLRRLVARKEKWDAPDPHTGCSPSKLGLKRANCTVTGMGLKATANDRRTCSPLPY